MRSKISEKPAKDERCVLTQRRRPSVKQQLLNTEKAGAEGKESYVPHVWGRQGKY